MESDTMSWEEILKEEGELPWDAMKDMYHEVNDAPNCQVRKCEAISCVNNYYEDFKEFGDGMKKCMLSDVDVDSNGKCKQFERAPNARSPGQQSLIDRTRQQTNKPPAPLGGESTYEEV